MGTKQTTHQRQSTQTSYCEPVTLPKLPLTKKIETYLGSAQTPGEIIYIIVSMLDSLSCLQLSMTSHLFPKFFTKYPIACLSSKTKLNPQLTRLYYKYCCQSSRSTTFLPQFLVLKNSGQLVEYKKTMHDDYLIIDFSEKLNFHSIDLSGISSLLINWPNNYKSDEDAIERSVDQFITFFQSQTYPNVKKLVLNNLVYTSDFINLLIGTFDKLKYLNIASYNTKSKFDIPISNFTTINELEITSPTSDDFADIIYFTLPIQLEKITFNSLMQNYKVVISYRNKVRTIQTLQCTSLKTMMILNNNFYDNDDINDELYIEIPLCIENLIIEYK
jgi:hypothetical protein